MANVINLNDPNQTVTQVLEELLERAKNGEIDSFVGLFSSSKSFNKAVAGNFTTEELFKYIGLLEVVKSEISLSLMAASEEGEE